MIDSLQKKLDRWHKHLDDMKKIEEDLFNLAASEKPLFAQLYLTTHGTVPERESHVHVSKAWQDYQNGLVSAKSNMNHAKRKLELLMKAFDAEYLTSKLDADAVRKYHP